MDILFVKVNPAKMEVWTLHISRGLYFGPKTIFTPPLLKMIISLSCNTPFFNSYHVLFALILPYFARILPFFFLFSLFLSPVFLFLYPFFLLVLHFPPSSLLLFIFSPQMTPADIPLGGGGGIFQCIDPCIFLKVGPVMVDLWYLICES